MSHVYNKNYIFCSFSKDASFFPPKPKQFKGSTIQPAIYETTAAARRTEKEKMFLPFFEMTQFVDVRTKK